MLSINIFKKVKNFLSLERNFILFLIFVFFINITFQFILFEENIFFIKENYFSELHGDQGFYDNAAFRMSKGEGYVDNYGRPTMAYQIGYPLFLSLIYYFCRSYEIVVIIQIILLLISLYLSLIIISNFSRNKIILLFFFLTFLSQYNFVKYSLTLLSEILGLILLTISIYFLYKFHISSNKLIYILITSLSFGFLILTRPVFLLFPLFGILMSLLTDHKKYFLYFSIVSILVIVPYLIRNYKTFDYIGIGSGSGLNLFIGITHSSPKILLKKYYGYEVDWGDLSSSGSEIKKMDKIFFIETINYIANSPFKALKNIIINIDSLLGGLIFKEFKVNKLFFLTGYITFFISLFTLIKFIILKKYDLFTIFISFLFLYLLLLQPIFIADQRQGIFLVYSSIFYSFISLSSLHKEIKS